MILYYALTTYHIQCCVVHKMTRKPNEKAVLLLSDIHKNSVAFLQRYKNSGIFDDVLLLEESRVNANVRRNSAKHRSKRRILHTACRQIKSALPVNPAQMDEVYLCPDHFPFGWYIITSKIKYHCFEEGCGVLSDNAFMLSNLKRNQAQYELMDVLGYFGANESAVEILADTQRQLEGYENDKMVDFSVERILKSLDENQLSAVLGFFGVDGKIGKSSDDISLILTQHMANLGIMPLEKQHLLYCLLADYFLENTYIAIKPHPDDIAGRYEEIFHGEAAVLPFAMPSELLPYCISGNIKTAIAANSTAVKSLDNICSRTICFDNRILTDFEDIHRLYCTLEIIKAIRQTAAQKESFTTNADELMLNELSKTENLDVSFEYSPDLPKQSGLSVISDNITEVCSYEEIYEYLNELTPEQAVIFLNEKSKYVFFDSIHTQVFKYLRPVFIGLKSDQGEQEQRVYVYSKNADILKGVENIKVNKELKYTGVSVDIHSISAEEREKIKLLEGVLEATEERLKEYIKNKKELDEKIAELEKRGRK